MVLASWKHTRMRYTEVSTTPILPLPRGMPEPQMIELGDHPRQRAVQRAASCFSHALALHQQQTPLPAQPQRRGPGHLHRLHHCIAPPWQGLKASLQTALWQSLGEGRPLLAIGVMQIFLHSAQHWDGFIMRLMQAYPSATWRLLPPARLQLTAPSFTSMARRAAASVTLPLVEQIVPLVVDEPLLAQQLAPQLAGFYRDFCRHMRDCPLPRPQSSPAAAVLARCLHGWQQNAGHFAALAHAGAGGSVGLERLRRYYQSPPPPPTFFS